MVIDLLREEQAPGVSALIRRNLREINMRDYPPELIEEYVDHFSAEQLLAYARRQPVFVAEEEGEIHGHHHMLKQLR